MCSNEETTALLTLLNDIWRVTCTTVVKLSDNFNLLAFYPGTSFQIWNLRNVKTVNGHYCLNREIEGEFNRKYPARIFIVFL
jgi:hypothetical protein